MTSRTATVLATGTAHTAKLFVAALAFTGAYVGFSAYDTANSAPKPQPVALVAQAVQVTTAATAEPGTITVATRSAGACAKALRAETVVISPDPSDTVLYGWRLQRWSATAKQWRTHLVEHGGFYAARKTLQWETRVADNPGWYRFELAVEGGETVRSERFQVSC
ncbi:hypothetical protein [Nonomuraea sp. NPDC050310]|uniref:hypothetical protein n=1 Tax=unclassified Nonomuraea TaxID=2593643 RepID=UPI0033C8627C